MAEQSWTRLFWGRPAITMDQRPVADEADTWERRYHRVLLWAPYALLAVSVVLSQLQPYPTPGDRLVVLGLAAVAAVWVLGMYTLRGERWQQSTGPMLVYFAGLLVISAVLESYAGFFLAFTITGFLQAFFVLPVVPAFIATAATSAVLYVSPGGSDFRHPAALPLLVFLVVLQTVTVGGGSFLGGKMNDQQERRRKLLRDLQAAQEENAGLHAQLLAQAREAGVLDERQRMAGEIHDTLAQGLTGIVTQLEAAEAAADRPDGWRPYVSQARALARESLSEARRSLQALRPEPLEGSHLPDAMADMARKWSATSQVAMTFETTGPPVPLLTELEVTLFRVAQEALANVAGHAGASRVGLTLSYTDDVVLLDVRDDGSGFDPATARATENGSGRGFGLRAMEQRLRRVAGRLEIESAPGAGTALSASVPAISRGGER